MKSSFFTLLSLVMFFQIIYAQYSWTAAEVHLKNGKVLNGEAKIPMMSATISLKKELLRYRATPKAKKIKYKPEAIDRVVFTIDYTERVNKKRVKKTRVETYISVFLNKKKTKLGFVELMIDGPLRLVGRTILVQQAGSWDYSGTTSFNNAPVYRPGFMGSHNQVMFLKEGQKPVVFNQASLTKSFRKHAMEYFKDCPSLKAKIEDKTFKKENLQDIVKYYNSKCQK